MKAFNDVVFGVGIALRLFALVLTVLQIYILIEAFHHRRGAAYRVFAAAQLVIGLCWFCLLLDGSYTVDYADRARSYPAAVEWIYQSPWLAVLGVDLLLAIPAIISILGIRHYTRTHLSQESIKETMDKLPIGICFAHENGAVILKNLRMDQISRSLTGRAMNDAAAFLEDADARGEHSGDVLFLTGADGATIQLSREEITLDDQTYTLLLAYDMTEQYRITAELKANNKKLIDIRLRMRAFGEEAAGLAMSEEILRARITVHDEVNHVLLSGRYYLDHPDTADAAQFIRTAQYTNRLLTREGEEHDDAAGDPYTEALLVARAIGVTVSVTGELPREKTARTLLGRAVRECAANTVKHSDDYALTVALSRADGLITAVLAGGGSADKDSFAETGGLLNLRRSVEAAGGVMTIEPQPRFTVTITMPET